MSKVQGLEGLQPDQINFEIQRGGKFIALPLRMLS